MDGPVRGVTGRLMTGPIDGPDVMRPLISPTRSAIVFGAVVVGPVGPVRGAGGGIWRLTEGPPIANFAGVGLLKLSLTFILGVGLSIVLGLGVVLSYPILGLDVVLGMVGRGGVGGAGVVGCGAVDEPALL